MDGQVACDRVMRNVAPSHSGWHTQPVTRVFVLSMSTVVAFKMHAACSLFCAGLHDSRPKSGAEKVQPLLEKKVFQRSNILNYAHRV